MMQRDLMSLACKSVRWTFAGIYCAALTACASQRVGVATVKVTSDPPGAAVDLNGAFLGKTPCIAPVSLRKEWVGLLYSRDGWGIDPLQKCEFTAYPPTGVRGSFQKKSVPSQSLMNGASVHFQFGAVTNLAPQDVNIRVGPLER